MMAFFFKDRHGINWKVATIGVKVPLLRNLALGWEPQ